MRQPIKFFIYTTFTILVFFSSPGFSSFEDLGGGARYQAMGRTAAGFINSADAIFLNCGGLAQINNFQTSLYYAIPYGIRELKQSTITALFPTHHGNLGIAAHIFGNNLYREQEFLLSYARSIKQKLYYGISLHTFHLSITNYGTRTAMGLDIGFITIINSRVKWGFFSRNINRPRINKQKETIPQIFTTGFSFTPLNNVLLNFDIYKDIEFPVELRFGFEYFLLQRLFLRSGFITEPAQFTAGFGIKLSYFTFDYAFQSHRDLGFTHQFSLTFSLLKSKKHPTYKKIKKISSPDIKININTASSEELQQLKGIGPVLAERIIQYRKQWGPFKNIDDLKNIRGISEDLFEQIKINITVQ